MKLHVDTISAKILGTLKQSTFESWCLRSIMVLTAAALATVALGQDGDSIGGRNGKAQMPEYIQEFFLSEAVRSQDKGELQVTFAGDSRQRIGTNAALQIE